MKFNKFLSKNIIFLVFIGIVSGKQKYCYSNFAAKCWNDDNYIVVTGPAKNADGKIDVGFDLRRTHVDGLLHMELIIDSRRKRYVFTNQTISSCKYLRGEGLEALTSLVLGNMSLAKIFPPCPIPPATYEVKNVPFSLEAVPVMYADGYVSLKIVFMFKEKQRIVKGFDLTTKQQFVLNRKNKC